MANRDLHEAMADCDQALYFRPYAPEETGTLVRESLSDDPDILDSRGLVYLRLGNPEDAKHDYDSALRANPRMSSSLYGRGLAELQLGENTQGHADLAAATKLDSGIVKRFADMGLTP
jgi:tetratricopeptide (TPR) repeat protein